MTSPNDYWRPGDDPGSRHFVTFYGPHDAGFTFEGGDLLKARTYVDRLVNRPPMPAGRAQLIHRHMEQYVIDRSTLTLLMYIQGTPDQALHTEEGNYAHAFGTGHALSQVNLLRQSACLISLYIGDVVTAEFFTKRLVELSRQYDLGVSAAMGACFEEIGRAHV